ncbi:hypothetical protein, partial [Vallitalea sediminicola]
MKKDKLIVTYSGSMYGRRKPDYFLQAVNELIDEQKIDKNDILIRFIGNIPNKKIKEINEIYSFNETVKYLPYMEHKKSI